MPTHCILSQSNETKQLNDFYRLPFTMKFLTSTFALFTLASQTMGASIEIEANSRSLRSAGVTQCKTYGLNEGEALLTMCPEGSPFVESLMCTYTLSDNHCVEAIAPGISHTQLYSYDQDETYIEIKDHSIVAIGKLPSSLVGLFISAARPIRNLSSVMMPPSTRTVEFVFESSSSNNVKNLKLELDLSGWKSFTGELTIETGPYAKVDISLGSIPISVLSILGMRNGAASASTELKISDLTLLSQLQSFSVEGLGAIDVVSFSLPSNLREFRFGYNRWVQSLDVTIPEDSKLQYLLIEMNMMLARLSINAHGNKLPATLQEVQMQDNINLVKISNLDFSLVTSSELSLDFSGCNLTSDSFIKGVPKSVAISYLAFAGNQFTKCPTKWTDHTVVASYSPPVGC